MNETTTESTPVEISDHQLAKMLGGEKSGPAEIAAEPVEAAVEEPSSDAGDKSVVEKPAAASEPANSQEPKEEDEETSKPGLKKRFRQLTGENRALKERLDKLEASAPKSEPGVASPAAAAEALKEPVMPDLETFKGTYPEYQKAMAKYVGDVTDYKLQLADKARAEKAERASEEQKHKDQAKSWNEAEAATMKRADRADYSEVADSVSLPRTAPGSAAVAQAIQRSKIGPELLYHLGKNPEVVSQLVALDPVDAVLQLGQIAASLITPAPKPKVPDQPLPKPPVIPAGGGAPAEVDPNDPKMSQSAFNSWMEKGEKRRGRR